MTVKYSSVAFAVVGLLLIGCDASPFMQDIMKKGQEMIQKGQEMMAQGPVAQEFKKIQDAMQGGGTEAIQKMQEGFETAIAEMGAKGEEFKEQVQALAQQMQDAGGPTGEMKQKAEEMMNQMKQAMAQG